MQQIISNAMPNLFSSTCHGARRDWTKRPSVRWCV